MGSSPATTGSILVERKKKSTSVHLRTRRMERAYAAGRARSRTSTVEKKEAVRELTSGGQGVGPPPPPKKVR